MYQISRENGKIFALLDDPGQLTARRVKPMAEKDEKEDVFVILGRRLGSVGIVEEEVVVV